ncbi:hypothetical protein CTI12_AA136660 [Artemisia annua]|uniref:Uncharacterized protein n=1 Tax=Artemisia annua TaxID=35608 RepID=A0A2U1PMA6_ARTAN|nr:hypothetical protein CTI12_AA136660 [Artemisia annua]
MTSTTLTTIATTPTPILTPIPAVQHVTKASSDELLSKFAELDSPKKKSLQLFKRRKKTVTNRRESLESMVVVERKSLLPPVGTGLGRRSSGAGVLVKVGRAHFKGRSFRKRSIFGAIEKTWQRTIDGASKVFMEKQYNRHKRLLSDTT